MITSRDYDVRIIAQGLQHQIDNYYMPKETSMKKRIEIVMDALQLKPGEKILDMGCGVGTFAFHCAKMDGFTVGIDYSLESIKAARLLCGKFGVNQNTNFLVGDACNLPFKANYFDKIVGADFIEHITCGQKELMLREICRILKPEGKVVIFTPNGVREKIGEWYWKIRHIFFRDTIPKTDLHFGLTNKREFEKMCEIRGLVCKLVYKDITRGYLAKIPILRNLLSLNLLWVIGRKDPTI